MRQDWKGSSKTVSYRQHNLCRKPIGSKDYKNWHTMSLNCHMKVIYKNHQLCVYIQEMYRSTNLTTLFKRAENFCKNYTLNPKLCCWKKLKISVSGDTHGAHELKTPHPQTPIQTRRNLRPMSTDSFDRNRQVACWHLYWNTKHLERTKQLWKNDSTWFLVLYGSIVTKTI